jgi:Zn-finger protein
MNSSSYFFNRFCEFYPCHEGVDGEQCNCLFCYCPLYRYKDCGGNYVMTAGGIKDCSKCTWVHKRSNYMKVIEKLAEKNKEKGKYGT